MKTIIKNRSFLIEFLTLRGIEYTVLQDGWAIRIEGDLTSGEFFELGIDFNEYINSKSDAPTL